MKIEVLFPEVCSLFGDLMNPGYLARSNSDIEIINTSLKAEPAFISQEIDMVYMGSMSERTQEIVINKLLPYKEKILQCIEDGKIFLVTGNALEIFGQYIENEDSSRVECLGLFNTYAKRKMLNRYNSLYLGKLEGMDIVGFKSQFAHSYGDVNDWPLFETVRGAGLNPDAKWEGFRKNNFFATYLLGPVIILNPPFAKYILSLMGVAQPKLAFEEAAYEVYYQRLSEYLEPTRDFMY